VYNPACHCRSRLVELQEAHDAARSEAEVHRQQLRATQQELESATIALADEQARLAALRAELGALEREKSAEVDARLRSVQELSSALAVSRCCCQQCLT
jgi:peptidoglycan hydrolase CwlO-like protein